MVRGIADKLASIFSSSVPSAGVRLTDDETSIQVLRAGSTVAIAFMIAYLASDLLSHQGGTQFGTIFHWVTILSALAFFFATWMRGFRRHWKHWTLAFAILVMFFNVLISSETQEGEPRYITLLLFPVATAAFVNWEWYWQALIGVACLALYAFAWLLIPVAGDNFARWLGLFAAITLAQCISFFIGIYRKRIDAQIDELKQAAAFREAQIATMAHDIRSPVAAIAGFVDLLDDENLREDDRKSILARIGTTAWLMDLTVSNVLDLYQISSGHVTAMPARVDPNRIVADAATNCVPQATHKGLNLAVDYGEVPRGNYDPRHLERIARNMLAFSIARLTTGEIRLRTHAAGNGIAIEVEDDGPLPSDEELTVLLSSASNGNRPTKSMLGLYVARALAEHSGGRVKVTLPTETTMKLIAEVPSAKTDSRPARVS